MAIDARYHDLNARFAAAMLAVEAMAPEVENYFQSLRGSVPPIDPDHLARIRASRGAAAAGLGDPDPAVRLAAIRHFSQMNTSPGGEPFTPPGEWAYGPDIAPVIAAMSVSDLDPEVQLCAVGAVGQLYPSQVVPVAVARGLAEVALGTEHVYLRNLIYQKLAAGSGVRVRGGAGRYFGFRMDLSVKYHVLLPVLFDADHVREILSELDEQEGRARRPAARLVNRLRKLLRPNL